MFARTSLGALFFLSLILSGAAAAEPWQITRSSGPVWFGSSATQLVSLGSNNEIPGGATLVTGDGGRAMLVRGEQVMLVGPKTVVTVPDSDRGGVTTVLQAAGEVTFDIDRQKVRHFSVETPYLAALVKGTRFTVRIKGNSAAVTVVRGLVGVTDFRTGERADVPAGQAATVAPNSSLEISGAGALATTIQGEPRDAIVEAVTPTETASTGDDPDEHDNSNSGKGDGGSGNSGSGNSGSGNSGSSNSGSGSSNSGGSNSGSGNSGNGGSNSGSGNSGSGNSNSGSGNGGGGNSNSGSGNNSGGGKGKG